MQQIIGKAVPAPGVLPLITPRESEEGFRLQESETREQWLLLAGVATAFLLFCCVAGSVFSDEGLFAGFVWIFVLFGLTAYLTVRGFRSWSATRYFEPAILDMADWPLRLGSEIPMRYQRRARTPQRVRRAEVALVCTEVATYQQGTDTRTVRERVVEQPLLSVSDPDARELLDLPFTVVVPLDAPPSFQVTRNVILWTIETTLVREGAPDVTSSFPLLVLPEVAL